jgi:hypothetical protein
MNWLSRLLGKSKADGRRTAETTPNAASPSRPAPTPVVEPSASGHDPTRDPEPPPAPRIAPEHASDTSVEPAPADDGWETEDDEPEEAEDAGEDDPTIGRYEPLDERTLDDADLQALRKEAERLALSGQHRIGPADGAGPGTLVEALMRLEGEGRVVSRVCDDAESGFYILYEPAPGRS